LVVLNANAELP